MRINYPLLTSVLILLFLMLLFSMGVQAQTASERPLSATLTPSIREHLKKPSTPATNNTSTQQLASSRAVPQQAVIAKQKHVHTRSGPRPQTPSASRASAEKYKKLKESSRR